MIYPFVPSACNFIFKNNVVIVNCTYMQFRKINKWINKYIKYYSQWTLIFLSYSHRETMYIFRQYPSNETWWLDSWYVWTVDDSRHCACSHERMLRVTTWWSWIVGAIPSYNKTCVTRIRNIARHQDIISLHDPVPRMCSSHNEGRILWIIIA